MDTSVPVRKYTPGRSARAGVVVWIHGGGYCVGTPDEDELFCLYLARDVGAVVVSVDYRLAPENPFPAGFEDCYAVVEAVDAEHRRGIRGRARRGRRRQCRSGPRGGGSSAQPG